MSITVRSNRVDVRNPMLALPAIARLRMLPPETREIIADVLRELRADASARAEKSWRQNKGPMAAYWKAVSVYALHIGRCLK